ncbi:hypothetical protein ACPCSP_25235 [Streptomyces cinereoruber]|uniref:DUF7848 domain-containing protein n=1 Tax=Streptomyces cinereoruber TaxID=67260 RepID=UPI003C2B0D26
MNRLFAFLQWRLDAIGPTVRAVTCRDCLETSEPGADLAAASKWAMDHAARTGHMDFDETTVTPLRASLLEGQSRAEAVR